MIKIFLLSSFNCVITCHPFRAKYSFIWLIPYSTITHYNKVRNQFLETSFSQKPGTECPLPTFEFQTQNLLPGGGNQINRFKIKSSIYAIFNTILELVSLQKENEQPSSCGTRFHLIGVYHYNIQIIYHLAHKQLYLPSK